MNVYTVGQVNSYIKNMFAQDYMLRAITVSGEASNVKYHSKGHLYFTLKDKSGSISCVMFASNVAKMKTRFYEGDQIEVTGSISIYEKTGSYQMYAVSVSLAGVGALYERFERLKEELRERGMFDDIYKQPIPRYAKRIGIVTAATGAAVQDIMQIAHRRNPYVQLVLYSALVQGEGAKESIVAGIKAMEVAGVDVIIVGRGGGSIEDLWAFNEECVAQAIFDCSIPIVSAVGHQTDYTIADFVADLRAPTPSAAAELTVFDYDDFIKDIELRKRQLSEAVTGRITAERNRTNSKQLRLQALSPMNKLRLNKITYMNKLQQLDEAMEKRLKLAKDSCLNRNSQMAQAMDRKLINTRHRFEIKLERYKSLSPLERLEHGYAGVSDKNGRKVTDVKNVKTGDELKLILRSGRIDALVTAVSDNEI